MSGGGPYLRAWRRRRRHQRAVEGWGPALARTVAPLAVAAALLPLVRPVFLSFLDEGPEAAADGLAGVVLRLGLVLVGAVSLDVYGALVRGPDRAVLDLHPVDAGAVVAVELRRVALERWWWAPVAAILLAPVAARVGPAAWLAAVLAVGSIQALAISASALMHLGAVRLAESEAAAPLLDLIRGSNPRAQAAFLYAPGAVLAAAGALVWAAAAGVAAAVDGGAGAAWIAAPAALGAALLLPVPGLARATWFRASAVIADIDARYAALESREDGTRVYLDWAVRWLPARLGPYALKDLRHGWRGRRAWITGGWLVGVAGALAGWQGGAAAPGVAAAVVVLGALGAAAVGVVLERDEPAFLRAWVPSPAAEARVARGLVVAAWVQGAVWLPLPALWLRHGLGAALAVLALGLVASAGGAALAAACSARPRGGLLLYAPSAALFAAALVLGARWGGVT